MTALVNISTEATGSGEWNGKRYFWDFSERFGPLFTTSKGEPCKNQPVRGPAWKAFEVWYAEYRKQRRAAARCGCVRV